MHRRSFLGSLFAGVAAWLGWHSAATARELYETCVPEPPTPGVFPICRADVPNSNGHLYTRQTLEDVASRMAGKTVPVVADGAYPPYGFEQVVGRATLHMEGDCLMATVDRPLPDTEYRTSVKARGEGRNGVFVVSEVTDFVAVLACRPQYAADLYPDARTSDACPPA